MYHFDAVIFDLDGVITDTASVHSRAWKQMFDEFLQAYANKTGTPFREFSHEADYLPYVDGKPRYKGVASFLESRGVDIPYGDPGDPPERETVCGLGNRKNEHFNQVIATDGVTVYQSTADIMRKLRAAGLRVGVASSSKNAEGVLTAAGLLDIIETRVDGVVSAEIGLKGKPEPDIFTTASDNLGVTYDRAVVVEDAISGVQAGQNGGFGLVIGIAREDNAHDLKRNGADIVVEDMAEIDIPRIEKWLTEQLPEEQWSISYFDYNPEKEGTREALLAVGNGYFGTRGALEETAAGESNYPGTYIAGLYNRLESEVGGRMVGNEDFVNAPNWLPMSFRIGAGTWFDPNTAEISHIERRLDFRSGVLQRTMVVRDTEGRQTRVESRRFASMDDPHRAGMRYQITPLNYAETITVRSTLDGDIINSNVARYRELSSKHLEPAAEQGEGDSSSLLVQTNQSAVKIAEAARLRVALNERAIQPNFEVVSAPGQVTTSFEIAIPQGGSLTVDKLVAIYASHQHAVSDPLAAAQAALKPDESFDALQEASARAWGAIWEKADIQITGDRMAQKLIRLHLYHTFVTSSPHTAQLDAGIPARGLHGEAYRGHIFWDELYILPFLNLHLPETVRSILMYRYNRLEAAREYARQHGFEGAMFPWQSGSGGGEETQTLHLNPLSGEWGEDYSTLQRHVSLAIAYNVWEYLWINEDQDFLEKYGAELFLEVCRFWAGKAEFDNDSGRYSIAGVMGPDEFHEKYPGTKVGGLKDNSYTNLLVAWALQRAFDLLDRLSPDAREQLRGQMRLTQAELKNWSDVAYNLRVPLSDTGILEQYEGYFSLEELDWETYRQKYDNIHRMDRILKAEGKSPDAYKVAKQADALMTFYVLSDEQVRAILHQLGYQPPDDLLRANFDYYLQRTSHGSTLSRLVHAYLAQSIGDAEMGWQLYMQALKSDYIDIQGGTTKEGIHAGVMTGTVLFALRAFAGVDYNGELLKLNPKLPAAWRKLCFSLGFKGDRYRFEIQPDTIKVRLEGQREKSISIFRKEIILEPGQWTSIEHI